MLWIVGGIWLILSALFTWALCRIAALSDAAMERME